MRWDTGVIDAPEVVCFSGEHVRHTFTGFIHVQTLNITYRRPTLSSLPRWSSDLTDHARLLSQGRDFISLLLISFPCNNVFVFALYHSLLLKIIFLAYRNITVHVTIVQSKKIVWALVLLFVSLSTIPARAAASLPREVAVVHAL